MGVEGFLTMDRWHWFERAVDRLAILLFLCENTGSSDHQKDCCTSNSGGCSTAVRLHYIKIFYRKVPSLMC
jgi:hypothetical protein